VGVGASGSLAAALTDAGDDPQVIKQVHDAFGDAVSTSQLIGATAVFAGGLLAGCLLHLADRSAAAATAPADPVEAPAAG
jgi:hypothetical protein